MRLIHHLFLLSFLFFATGCVVSSYKSTADIPQNMRPSYDTIYSYMSCCDKKFTELYLAETEYVPETSSEDRLVELVEVAADSCQVELDAFHTFVHQAVDDQSIADKETRKLKKRTAEKIVARTTAVAKDLL